MSDKLRISTAGVYINKKISISDTVRIVENMASISTVIFSKITPSVSENSVRNKTFFYSGNCIGEVMYVSENGGCDRISFSIPFEMTEPCEKDSGVFWGKCEVSDVEIIPIKGRRCDVSITVTVSGQMLFDEEISTLPDYGYNIPIFKDEQYKELSGISVVRSAAAYEYSHSSGFSEGVKIIYASADVCDVKANHSPAGVLVNGFIKKCILYSHLNDDDTYSYHVIDENVAFSNFCEVPYSVKFNDYSAECKVSMADAYTQPDSDDTEIHMDVKLDIGTRLINNIRVGSIRDIFSPEMNISCEYVSKKCIKIEKVLQKEIIFKDISDIKYGSIASMAVAAMENVKITEVRDNKGRDMEINLNAGCILLFGDDNEPSVFSCDMKERLGAGSVMKEGGEYFCEYTIIDTVRNVTSSAMETVCKVLVELYEMNEVSIIEVSDISVSEYETENNDYIKVNIYYQTEGMSVFEIAKKSRKSPEEISMLTLGHEDASDFTPIIIWEQA